ANASELPTQTPDWLARAGTLAAGAAGERAYAQARARAQAVLDLARGFLAGAQPCVQPIDLDLGDGGRLARAGDAWRSAAGAVRVLRTKPNRAATLKELLPFYIDFAAVSLYGEADALFVEYDKKAQRPKLLDAIVGQNSETLRAGLRQLIDLATTS